MEERGATIGVLNVESEDVDAFDERALKVLTLLSNEASKVIGRLWLIEQLRRRALQMEALIGMGQSLVLEIDLGELLQRLTRNALKITDCCLCALFLYEGEEELLRLEAWPMNPVFATTARFSSSRIPRSVPQFYARGRWKSWTYEKQRSTTLPS